jgi:hypothetical protein
VCRASRSATYLDAIGGEEQDALEVLELSQEDADERIAVDVGNVAFLEEHVRFVQQEDGSPCVADVQYLLQLLLQESRIRAELAG